MSKASEERRVGPWGPRTLEDGESEVVRFGHLQLHLARRGDEIRAAHFRQPSGRDVAPAVGALAVEGELDWSRWATRDATGRVHLRPAFPDRPLVVAPEDPFHLLGGAEARIYVRVPLWVTVVHADTTLITLPTIPFSDTWWGTEEEGELCYWLTTHARREIAEPLFEPHLAMCPLRLVNRSDDDLTVEKVALRTAYLGLYAEGERIWSDETRVRFEGEAEGSRLEMAGKPPTEAPDARLLAPPRLKMTLGFRARTFGRIRSLQGWIA
jgi:hypothetical protein